MSTKERPILFSTPMVTAILEGRKTQTRRVVKDPLDTKGGQFCVEYADTDPNVLVHVHNPKCEGYCDYTCHYPCPYGQVGDRLWVRETFCKCQMGKFNHVLDACYKSDYTRLCNDVKWHPSIHMPRWASRITLELTDVRVERLQDISPQDAIAEGVFSPKLGCRGRNAKTIFHNLWDSLNTKRGYGWVTNPWVWAISFKVVPPCPSS